MSFTQDEIKGFVLDEETVKKFCREDWCKLEDGKYEKNDRALYTLVEKLPGQAWESLAPKAIVLNELYSTQVHYFNDVLSEMCRIKDLQARIDSGDVTVVDDIAKYKRGDDKERNNLSFASKYCCMHANDKFPIYDHIVRAMLAALKKRDKFTEISLSSIKEYGDYKAVYDDLIVFYKLENCTYREIDKCLWTKGKQIKANRP